MTPRRKTPKSRGLTEPKNGDFARGVLLEDINGKLNVVIEAVQGCATKGEVAQLREETQGLKHQITDVAESLRATRREVAARFDGVDKRFDRVDQRFDGIDQRLDGLHQQLREIRQDVSLQAQGTELRALEQRVTVLERAQSSSSRT